MKNHTSSGTVQVPRYEEPSIDRDRRRRKKRRFQFSPHNDREQRRRGCAVEVAALLALQAAIITYSTGISGTGTVLVTATTTTVLKGFQVEAIWDYRTCRPVLRTYIG